MSYSPGDVVELKSGGNPMTVVDMTGNVVTLAWHDDIGAMHDVCIRSECLRAVPIEDQGLEDGECFENEVDGDYVGLIETLKCGHTVYVPGPSVVGAYIIQDDAGPGLVPKKDDIQPCCLHWLCIKFGSSENDLPEDASGHSVEDQ